MSSHPTAEIIGAHMALSTPIAIAWRRVVDGEIPAEEAMMLMESDEERELARRVFTVPTPERREALLVALLARLADEDAGAGVDGTSRRSAKPPALPRPWRRRGILLAALVAAVVLVSILPRPRGGLPTLCTYTLDPLPGEAVWRSSPEATRAPSYSRASRLRTVLRPSEPVEGPVGLVAFARSPDGQSVVLELEPRIAPNGLVSIDVPMRDTGLHEGDWELVLVVGRPEALPASWKALELAPLAREQPEYQVLRASIRVVAQRGGT